ncbi:hypothetical protein E2C01_003270 [Portunus trituberculatus]|uniref:Uncharacterized protein n=1 Tax=Portunus trituberculatus TaxID=210409 RepID=A0A5B7CLR9_PORTR|nr:hypothetical protein [Portunus trituberculatus]
MKLVGCLAEDKSYPHEGLAEEQNPKGQNGGSGVCTMMTVRSQVRFIRTLCSCCSSEGVLGKEVVGDAVTWLVRSSLLVYQLLPVVMLVLWEDVNLMYLDMKFRKQDPDGWSTLQQPCLMTSSQVALPDSTLASVQLAMLNASVQVPSIFELDSVNGVGNPTVDTDGNLLSDFLKPEACGSEIL